ncbi:MAG: excisionase family DNA-binding protein [Vicinamibacterales bacterium]
MRKSSRNQAPGPVWLAVDEAAQRANIGRRTIYSEVRAGRLRAALVGDRRQIRIRPEWIDQWLEASATPVPVSAPGPRAVNE